MLTYGPAVLTIFAIFFGIITGRRDVNALKQDIKDDMARQFGEVARQFTEVNRWLTRLETDYLQFYGMEKKLEGRVAELSRR